MNASELGHALHVTASEAAAGSLRVALGLSRDQMLISEDPLSFGPAPATRDLGVWRAAREAFLRDMYIEWPGFTFDAGGSRGLLLNGERLAREASVVVWIAAGLPEQLFLAWLVFLFDCQELDLAKLRVIFFERLRPEQQVLGMGELRPQDIRDFRPAPRRLSAEEAAELRQAWRVYTSDDPADLAAYADGPSPMPGLRQAIGRLIYRYPDRRSGLGIWDARLLHNVLERGPRTIRVIGYTMGYNETLDLADDSYLFYRLVGLGPADLASPLVSITGNGKIMRDSEVVLTGFGKQVMTGAANHVRENGIDDWIGGVHLSAETGITFRQDDTLLLDS